MNSLLVLWTLANSATLVSPRDVSYLCIVDQATGFAFDAVTREWKVTRFTRDLPKLVITRPVHLPVSDPKSKLLNDAKWIVKLVGSTLPIPNNWCKDDFSVDGSIECDGLDSKFLMNRGGMRFMLVHTLGYWDVGPGIVRDSAVSSAFVEGGDTPAIMIGKCATVTP
jgi:hypothetical protein